VDCGRRFDDRTPVALVYEVRLGLDVVGAAVERVRVAVFRGLWCVERRHRVRAAVEEA
jgi:hypothetical protein